MRGGVTGLGEARGVLTESCVAPSAKSGHSRPGTGPASARGRNLAPDRGLSPLGAVESQAVDGKREPVVGVRLHQRPVFSPSFPPAKGNGRDVAGVVLRPARAHSLQHEEAPKQPHPHVHLTEVDEDGHQSDELGREVLQLEPVVLQQREEEGGQWRHQPSQGVRHKEDKVTRPHVGQ
jgi:hypothetical protein